MRHEVTTNDSLEAVDKINQLDRFITRAPGVRWVTQKTMSATVEAIVGAAYEDGDMEAAQQVVKSLGINALDQEKPEELAPPVGAGNA